jgi:rhodanese-related sulfurtransferase
MKKAVFFGFIVLSLSLWTGCGSTSDERIDANEFVEWTQKKDVVVLDVRSREEYASSHWPEATLLDYDGGEFGKRKAELDQKKRT